MAERGRGSIIMITSMAALYGIPGVSAYTASKAAVLGMTRALVTGFLFTITVNYYKINLGKKG